MYQAEFTQLYDRLMKYAYYKAGWYFKDPALRQDATDDAVNTAVDNWVDGEPYDEAKAKRVINNSLRRSSRNKKLQPMRSEEYPPYIETSMRGYIIR